MQATQETTIGGRKFAVTQLPGMASLKLLPRLGKVLGPALGKAAAALPKGKGAEKGSLIELDVGALGEAIPLLFEKLEPEELEQLTRLLLQAATVDGRPLMQEFDLTMQGRAFDSLKLLWFALEVNYGNFTGALVAAGFVPGVTRESPSTASSTSNGLRGVS